MLKHVVVFGSKASEDIIGNIIEDNLPVDVIKLTNQNNQEYTYRTESELREWIEEELSPYLGKVDAIVLCEPEMTLSSIQFLKDKYPDQEIVGYGQELVRVLKDEPSARILLPQIVRRMTRYQEMKVECFGTKISEEGYAPGLKFSNLAEASSAVDRALENFPGGLVVIYSPDLVCLKKQLKKRAKWRATVVDMCDSLFRETCKALKFRGVDGRLARDIVG